MGEGGAGSMDGKRGGKESTSEKVVTFKTKVKGSFHKPSEFYKIMECISHGVDKKSWTSSWVNSAQPGHGRAATAVLYFVWRRR